MKDIPVPAPRMSSPYPPLSAQPPKPPQPIGNSLLIMLAALCIGDFLLWRARPGLSLAIFTAILTVLLAAVCGRKASAARVWCAAGLLLIACVQTAIDICFTNVAVVIALLLILLGETSFGKLPAGWARWWEAFVSLCCAPGRWFWLANALARPAAAGGVPGRSHAAAASRWFRILAPAAVLTVIFAILLGQGNAILGAWFFRAWTVFTRWIASFDLSAERIVFWVFLSTFLLALFRPRPGPDKARLFTQPPGIWQRADPTLARWQSLAVLAILNVLFFVANTIDAIYLWHSQRIPDGVLNKAFVHAGTNSLITATILSALVLCAIFQQQRALSRNRVLRGLAHVWVVQNLVLLAGVGLRLKLYYDETHLLTATRIHLACFLALVTLGFLFLVLHIERGPDLRRLIWRNAVAVFVLFYALQFIDTTGIAARWNAGKWLRDPAWGLGYPYLLEQGEDAWPSLLKVAAADRSESFVDEARTQVGEIASRESKRLSHQDWREIQWRRDRNAREVIAAAAAVERLAR